MILTLISNLTITNNKQKKNKQQQKSNIITQNIITHNIEHLKNPNTQNFLPITISTSLNPKPSQSITNPQTPYITKNMSRDTLKLIKQFYQQFQSLESIKLTQHSLCTIEPYCEFLSLISPVFYLSELANGMNEVYRFKQLMKVVKRHLKETRQKGIKISDIDLVDLTRNESLEQVRKLFEVMLCVMVQSDKKDEFISYIMLMQQSDQQKLASITSTALLRLCQPQTQQKQQLLTSLLTIQQQNQHLYQQLSTLQQQNTTLKNQLSQSQFNSQQYQRQRTLYMLNKSSYQATVQMSEQISQQSTIGGVLRQKLIQQEQEHSQEVQELCDKIGGLEDKIRQISHYEELLVIYQEKYQEALAYVEKVSLYEKEKNKLKQEIMHRDLIVEELKEQLQEANHKIVQLQQEKVDLELLLAKKNLQVRNAIRSNNTSRNNTKIINHNSNQQSLHLTAIPLKRLQTSISPQYTTKSITHHRQSSQLTHILAQQQQLSILSLNKSILTPPITQLLQKVSSLQSTSESQSLQIKRLQRKCTQLKKANQSYKQKLKCMRVVQNQNSKLQKIVIELNTRKSQQIDLLVNCLYETHHDFDFRFNKLLGNRNYQDQNKHLSDILGAERCDKGHEFKDIINFTQTDSKQNTKPGCYSLRQDRRTPSLKIQPRNQCNSRQDIKNLPIVEVGQRTQADIE